MNRILSHVAVVAALAFPTAMFAQYSQAPAKDPYTLNHVEIGVFGELFRTYPSSGSNVNFLGLGGRLGINVNPNVALEAEMGYDFEKNYTTVSTTGGTTTNVTSKVRPLTGLFGPKFQFGTSGPFRAFVTTKVGFTDFSVNNGPASGTSFTGAVQGVGNGGAHLAVYPGAGFEVFGGPIGFRVEAGDNIYFSNGANNNLRVTFGPTFRF